MRVLLLFLSFMVHCQPADNSTAGAAALAVGQKIGEPDALGQALLDEVNALRARGCHCPNRRWYAPAPALSWSDPLARSARRHAEDMQRRNYFNHTGSDGSDFTDRIRATGYDWQAAAENLAMGQSSVREVVKDWETSEGHCQNLMNQRLREMGAAKVGRFWVQDFGSRK